MSYEVITTDALPERLRDLNDPPEALYVAGRLDLSERPVVAIVGARSCSPYGASIARTWATALAEKGVIILSGLARGIDGEAHRGALDVGGMTVAVMGCGIDRCYPAAHAALYDRIIAEGGAIVSEYEPGTPPAPWRFPARNRIVAALADAVLVVEARERSGALITADHAMELGRPVAAIPGEITSLLSRGTNDLIGHYGAQLVTAPDDVMGLLGPAYARMAGAS